MYLIIHNPAGKTQVQHLEILKVIDAVKISRTCLSNVMQIKAPQT